MPTILHITASIHGDNSVSRGLSSKLVAGLAKRDGAHVIERDLSANDMPYVTAERFAANAVPQEDRTPEQKELMALADALVEELEAADTIVMGIPIYNFSVPATVKAWADLVARAGVTFKYTPEGAVGLLQGKRGFVTVASGGTKVDSEFDFMTPWLRQFLGFLGIADVTFIAADARMSDGGAERIAEAEKEIETICA